MLPQRAMRLILGAAILLCANAAMSGAQTAGRASATETFHCAMDATCPEVTIAGDPYATLGSNPAPYRGYGDPSLERDPATGDLWLAYSWLDLLISDPGPPPVVDFGVRTHLAKSTDGGATFSFIREVNSTDPITHPDTSDSGWAIHEVSSLVREPPGTWQMQWFTYFDPNGPAQRYDFRYTRSTAAAAAGLGDSSAPWIGTDATSPYWGVPHNLNEIPELNDCTAITEPALFAHSGETYLASSCVVFEGTVRQDDQERLFLLRQEASGYTYAGQLLDSADAAYLGGSRVEQADLSLASNGAILLIVTPIQNSAPEHLGCVVLELTDIASASVRRDAGGNPVRLSEITGEDSTIGPGACTYDAASATGVLMVLHDYTVSPFDLEFTVRATGLHPVGLDTDADGLADSADADDDNDGFSDVAEAGLPLCGDGRNEDGVIASGADDGVVDDGCPGGPPQAGAYSEGGFNIGTDAIAPCGNAAWPLDFVSGGVPDSTDRVTVTDLTSFLAPARRLDTSPGDLLFSARWDLVPGRGLFAGWLSVNDLTALLAGQTGFPPMFGGAKAFGGPPCTPPP